MSLSFFISESRPRRFETLPLELTPTKSSATIDSTVAMSCVPTAPSQRFSLSFNAASTLIFFAGFSAAGEAAGEGEVAAAVSFFLAAGDSSEVAVDFADGVGVAVSCTVVEAFSSGATEGASSCASAEVTKLSAAIPRSDVINFIWISFSEVTFLNAGSRSTRSPAPAVTKRNLRSIRVIVVEAYEGSRSAVKAYCVRIETVGRSREQSLNTQRLRYRP